MGTVTAPDLFVRLVDGDEFVSASLPVSEDGKARWVPSQTVPRVTGYVLFDVTGRELLRHDFVQPGAGYLPGWPVIIHRLRPDLGPTLDAYVGWKMRPTSTGEPEPVITSRDAWLHGWNAGRKDTLRRIEVGLTNQPDEHDTANPFGPNR